MEDLWEERCDHGHGFKSDLYNALDYNSCDDDDDQLYLNTLIFSTIYSWFPKEVC